MIHLQNIWLFLINQITLFYTVNLDKLSHPNTLRQQFIANTKNNVGLDF